MNKEERAKMDEWLRTPESDAPVPDFVERDLEKPFEIDLSEWAEVEPLPDFAERVVRAILEMRSRERREGVEQRPSESQNEGQAPRSGPKSSSGRKTPEEPPRPSRAYPLPTGGRAAAPRR